MQSILDTFLPIPSDGIHTSLYQLSQCVTSPQYLTPIQVLHFILHRNFPFFGDITREENPQTISLSSLNTLSDLVTPEFFTLAYFPNTGAGLVWVDRELMFPECPSNITAIREYITSTRNAFLLGQREWYRALSNLVWLDELGEGEIKDTVFLRVIHAFKAVEYYIDTLKTQPYINSLHQAQLVLIFQKCAFSTQQPTRFYLAALGFASLFIRGKNRGVCIYSILKSIPDPFKGEVYIQEPPRGLTYDSPIKREFHLICSNGYCHVRKVAKIYDRPKYDGVEEIKQILEEQKKVKFSIN